MRGAGLTPLTTLEAAWQVQGHLARLRAVQASASQLGEAITSGPRVIAVRTLPLFTLLYPRAEALGAVGASLPHVLLTRRCVLVQFLQRGQPKTLLFNPSDPTAPSRAPFFQRQAAGAALMRRTLERRFEPLGEQLQGLGLSPGSIDYLAFNHLELEDVRQAVDEFREATLLAPESEWEDTTQVHPAARAWQVPQGAAGVPRDRVQLTAGDVMLGDGVYLIRTPGRTRGHQTLILSTASGVWGVSANGVTTDSWSPLDSQLRGLARACRQRGLDVAPSASVLSCGADQHASMVLERSLVSRAPHAPAFVQLLPASELTASPIAPGLSPTVTLGGIHCGRLALTGQPA
ncbi:MAG: hypothetical protein KIT72_05720 [Polyangiaceae bacterium]|nr:hypothetical protein [Polyangiaceae bacterium]MCW5789898.1 hypothetical protein [Polyangiaceae bacterium]